MVFFLSQFLESQPVCFKIAREQFLSSSSQLLLPVLLQWPMGLISLGLFIPILSFTRLLPRWLPTVTLGRLSLNMCTAQAPVSL